jgi:hypothetical protein
MIDAWLYVDLSYTDENIQGIATEKIHCISSKATLECILFLSHECIIVNIKAFSLLSISSKSTWKDSQSWYACSV